MQILNGLKMHTAQKYSFIFLSNMACVSQHLAVEEF